MASKYYAVGEGRVPGIYNTWAECQEQINGFRNASFKSFDNKEEAEEFVKGVHSQSIIKQPTSDIDVQIYVDGSWNDRKQQYGWGYVLVVDGESVDSGYGKGNKPEYLDQHQISGEVVAVLQGLGRAVYLGYKHAEIVYDYLGIEKWPLGDWKAKSDIAGAYLHLIKQYHHQIDLSFKKVKSHSGDRFNDEADQLAKKGANKS